MNPALTGRRGGFLLMVAATICWSLGGLIVRHLSVTNAWEIVFLRSLFSAGALALVYLYSRRRGRHCSGQGEHRFGLRRAHLISGAMFAVMITFFILAITRTTVANAQAIMALAPCFAAVGAWWVLKEKVGVRVWVSIGCAVGGVVLMFADALGGGGLIGNLLALVVPIAYGMNVTVLRKAHLALDMVPAVLVGSVLSALVAAPWAFPLTATAADIGLLAFMGSVQLALGCVLFVRAARFLLAAELSLIGLLETVLAPLWVWLAIGERPGAMALVGASIVVGALAVNEVFAVARSRWMLPAGLRR